jgi:glycosyltransferase involved in cell wall biosynthesis
LATTELLVWTENYWIGGCDRFLIDLISGLHEYPVRISLAGNEHPEFDAWLATRAPGVLPREIVPIANLVRSPLAALERRVRPGLQTDWEPSRAEGTPHDGPLVRGAAVAAVRYAQDAFNLPRLYGLLRRRPPHVLLINNGGYPGGESCRLAALAARAVGVPRVLHFVHNMANPPMWPPVLERAFDRKVDGATDVWITAAHRASDALATRLGAAPDRIRTVHYGLPPSAPPRAGARPSLRAELGYTDDALSLVAIANFEPRKGLGVLLSALAALRDESVLVRTAVVGDGPLRRALAARVMELSLGDRVRFVGWRNDVDDILAAADALALPSLSHECLPYVILEAMSHGLAVVSTDVAGIPEMVIDGDTGRVVPPGDVSALAGALSELAASSPRRQAMGERGYARQREHFTLERMTREMAALIGLP